MGREGGGGSGKTVVRLGKWTAEGLERAQVHWPGKEGGKSRGKIWNCMVLPPSATSDPETDDETRDDTAPPKAPQGSDYIQVSLFLLWFWTWLYSTFPVAKETVIF